MFTEVFKKVAQFLTERGLTTKNESELLQCGHVLFVDAEEVRDGTNRVTSVSAGFVVDGVNKTQKIDFQDFPKTGSSASDLKSQYENIFPTSVRVIVLED